MRYLSALTVMGLMAASMATPPPAPLRLAPRDQPPKSKRQAELTARADRRRARRNGDA